METIRRKIRFSEPPVGGAPKPPKQEEPRDAFGQGPKEGIIGTDVAEPVRCALCGGKAGQIETLEMGAKVHIQCLSNEAVRANVIQPFVDDALQVERQMRERKEKALAVVAAPEKPARYFVSGPESCDGVVIHGSDPTMQAAYRQFAMNSLGMGDYVPISIPQGLGRLVSPLSMKFASELLGCISEVVQANGSKRVVCIVRREEVESTVLRHLVHVPQGSDLATHLLAIGKAAIKKRLGVDVEMYLAQVEGDEVKFFRLDG
jgi:hypothetical protein